MEFDLYSISLLQNEMAHQDEFLHVLPRNNYMLHNKTLLE
jgi:hypothetical protein